MESEEHKQDPAEVRFLKEREAFERQSEEVQEFLERREAADRLYPANTEEVEYPVTGTAGDSITWTLTADGVITFSGTGEIPDYSLGETEWNPYEEPGVITSIVIEEGITGIGEYAFMLCDYLTEVFIPASVMHIDRSAFDTDTLAGAVLTGYDGTLAELFGKTLSKSFNCLNEDTESVIISKPFEAFTWTLTDEGHLSISGEGEFLDTYYLSNQVPWYELAKCIITAELSEGVQNLSSNIFDACYNLSSLTIPKSVGKIHGDYMSPELIISYDATVAELYANACGIAFSSLDENKDSVVDSGLIDETIKWILYDITVLWLKEPVLWEQNHTIVIDFRGETILI